MQKFYKVNHEIVVIEQGQEFLVQADWVEMTVEEIELFKNPPKTAEQIIAGFKSMYLAAVDAKLKELDYDSLATVKLWADDVNYGVEATRILTWYKNIIKMNYDLITSVTRVVNPLPVPTEVQYQAMIDGVVF